MAKYVWLGVAMQVAMVVAGHFVEAVLLLSAVLGTGIPFVLGIVYGAREPRSWGGSLKGGFLLGIVGAFIGVVVTILLGDQNWTLLTFAPLSSGVTGAMGAVLGTGMAGRAKRA